MAGLNLNLMGSAGVQAALPPSMSGTDAGQTLSSRAYGVGASDAVGPKTAAYGSVGIAIGSLALLVFIWHSLPR
jgi:hypothetical protein